MCGHKSKKREPQGYPAGSGRRPQGPSGSHSGKRCRCKRPAWLQHQNDPSRSVRPRCSPVGRRCDRRKTLAKTLDNDPAGLCRKGLGELMLTPWRKTATACRAGTVALALLILASAGARAQTPEPEQGSEIGTVVEAFLSPHQEPGEEKDAPKRALPDALKSTGSPVLRANRTGRGYGKVRFTKDLSRASSTSNSRTSRPPTWSCFTSIADAPTCSVRSSSTSATSTS